MLSCHHIQIQSIYPVTLLWHGLLRLFELFECDHRALDRNQHSVTVCRLHSSHCRSALEGQTEDHRVELLQSKGCDGQQWYILEEEEGQIGPRLWTQCQHCVLQRQCYQCLVGTVDWCRLIPDQLVTYTCYIPLVLVYNFNACVYVCVCVCVWEEGGEGDGNNVCPLSLQSGGYTLPYIWSCSHQLNCILIIT